MQEPEALGEAPTQVLLPTPSDPQVPASSPTSLSLNRSLPARLPPNTVCHCVDEGPELRMEHQMSGFPGRHRCREEQVQP